MYGLVAMIFPSITGAIEYAYEARPYGLVLGFSALALLCWQYAAEIPRRVLPLMGLCVSLAAAVSCHYYAVLVFLPLFTGELVRSITKKQVDIPLWTALIMGLFPLALFFPLIKAAGTYSGAFWATPKWTNMIGFYNTLLVPSALALFAITILVGAILSVRSTPTKSRPGSFRRIPVHELVAVSAFALLPAITVLVAEVLHGAFNLRYVLPALIGLSILLAWSLSKAFNNTTGAGLAIVMALLVLSGVNGLKLYTNLRADLEDRLSNYRFLQANAAGDIPVVIAGPHMFFEASHYLSHDLAKDSKSRLVYLADKQSALQSTGTDTVERGLLTLKQWAPLEVRDFHQFCAAHKEFLVYAYPSPFEWLLEELIKEGRIVVVKARNGEQLLFLVSVK